MCAIPQLISASMFLSIDCRFKILHPNTLNVSKDCLNIDHEILILDEIEDSFSNTGFIIQILSRRELKTGFYFPFVLSATDVQCRGEIHCSSLFNFVKPIFLQKSILVYNKAVLSF